MTNLQQDKLLELLADETLFGLSAKERMELEELKKQFPDWDEDVSLELAAAAIGLSNLDIEEDLPASLRSKIFADADGYFTQSEHSQETVNSSAPVFENIVNRFEPEPVRQPIWQWLGWAFAAAACVALAVTLWTTNSRQQPEVVKNPPVNQTPTPQLSAEQERARLLTTASDAVKISLTDPKNAKEIVGEMVWSNLMQKGYARFNRLPVNDASKETYQLWIVDETQNPKTPVSGGVFNISKTGEVIIPIDPQLTIKKPAAIAVTAEKPGGVVVSAQEKVVAFAKI